MEKLSKSQIKERAYARLDVTDRACDGCGKRIGRWTHKCEYDRVEDRCYGNACGCAGEWRDADKCSSCERVLIGDVDFQEFKSGRGPRLVCTACLDNADGPEGEYLHGFQIMDPDRYAHDLSPDQIEAVKAGPFVVIERYNAYSVVRPTPDGFHVKSALSLGPAFEKCAEFNSPSA